MTAETCQGVRRTSDNGQVTVLIALAAGATGSVVTAAIAYGVRIARVRREIDANERALRLLDIHLESWVNDETLLLRRDLAHITNSMVADPETGRERNLLWSGEHGYQIARAKEAALHRYRDQERTAQSHAADIVAREGSVHALARWWSTIPEPALRAPACVRPVLDRWAAPVRRHLSGEADEPLAIDDPRLRTVEKTLTALDGDPKALV